MSSKPIILIVQFRTNATLAHEQQCFLEEYGDEATLHFVNAITDELAPELLDTPTAVIISGSGEFYLTQGDGKDTWLPKTLRFIGQVLDRDIPLLGICFGFQLLAIQQGGVVERVEAMKETGTLEIQLFPSAYNDELFESLPDNFLGQLGHKDTITKLPKHVIPLAKSEKVPFQAFRVQGKMAWGTLFHPELNRERMRSRLLLSPEYALDQSNIEQALALFRDTPEAAHILHLFIKLQQQYLFLPDLELSKS